MDISDLEAALRSEDSGKMYETPREEIARLRKMELEPEHYDVDISKEVKSNVYLHHSLPGIEFLSFPLFLEFALGT